LTIGQISNSTSLLDSLLLPRALALHNIHILGLQLPEKFEEELTKLASKVISFMSLVREVNGVTGKTTEAYDVRRASSPKLRLRGKKSG